MQKRILTILSALLLSACATGTVTSFAEGKLEGPKIVALDAPRTPWVLEIESRLRREGFQVLRWASTSRVKEQTSETRVEEFRKSAARYILVVDGFAPLDRMSRCIAGGYNFDYLQVELVDTRTNETVLNVSGSGYSENCPPASGTIFSDITNALNRAWK
jgi:hypothetical protein